MRECTKEGSCFGCMCWGSYNTGGIKYCLCGYEKRNNKQMEQEGK